MTAKKNAPQAMRPAARSPTHQLHLEEKPQAVKTYGTASVTLISAALHLAELGWAVFPCKGKVPALPGRGFKDATRDRAQIARWWPKGARHDIGAVPPAGCYVLDIDKYKDPKLEALAIRLAGVHTPYQRSGGGGVHVVLRGKPPSAKALRDLYGVKGGIDIKAHGKGYVIVAPSVHGETGGVYEWATPPDVSIADAPSWLGNGTTSVAIEDDGVDTAWAHRANVPVGEVVRALRELDANCDNDTWVRYGQAVKLEYGNDGWPVWHEWSRTGTEKYAGTEDCLKRWESFGNNVASGSKPVTVRTILHDARAVAASPPGRALAVTSADKIEMENVEWLWHGWLPRKFLTVFAADSGSGKSTVTAAIVAALTAPKSWPNEPLLAGRKASSVLWLGVEDPHAVMTVPRLAAAGADRSRVHFVDGVTARGVTTTFSLQDDLDLLRGEVRAMRARGQEVTAIVVDPVTGYLHGKKRIDPHKATELREVLTPFAQLANEEDVAVVCITHLTKDKARGFIDSVLGSGALVQLARLCVGFARVPGEGEDSFAMFWGKGNLPAQQPAAIRYRIRSATVKEKGRLITTSRVEWGEEDATITKDSMIGAARGPLPMARNDAAAWLRQRMRDGQWHKAEAVRAEAMEAEFSPATIRRAADEICEKKNIRGAYHWRLRQVVALPPT